MPITAWNWICPSLSVQYHCDWHVGEEAARLNCFPASERVADLFAHFIGACTRPRVPASPDETVQTYRTGFPQAMQKRALDLSWPPYLVSWVYVLRSCPSPLLFHTAVERLVESLLASDPPETDCVQALRQYYLTVVPGRKYHIRQLESLISADWWCGLARLQPGSASGTQAQETWHRHKLKKYISNMRQSVPAFVSSLELFSKSRLQQLQLQYPVLPDIPVEPFPDKFVMFDSHSLTGLGRSSAGQYHRCSAFDVFPDELGNVWYCMCRTLASYQRADGSWTNRPDCDVPKPEPGMAMALRAVFLARDEAALSLALQHLSCLVGGRVDLESLYKLLSKHVLVLRGSLAAEFWHIKTEAGHMPQYRQAACFNCHVFSLHGSCEHVHAAWLHGGQLSMTVAEIPSRGRKKPAKPNPKPTIVQPARKRQRSSAASSAFPAFAGSGALRALLSQLGFLNFWPMLATQQVTIASLASFDLPAMKAYFPDMPAGPASRLLHACKEHVRT